MVHFAACKQSNQAHKILILIIIINSEHHKKPIKT